MGQKEKDKEQTHHTETVFRLNGLWVSYAHTACAGAAFVAALILGCLLHYEKIVTNEFYSFPHEWFPSVSATIGDRYPERSVYQLLIALTSGPRFLVVFLSYILTAKAGSSAPLWLAAVGTLRTFTCGGWTYITSTDDHDWHDIFMISYLVLTIPWTVLRTVLTPSGTKARKYRRNTALMFFATIVPLIYFFVQHKVRQIAGAYTIYAFFEWTLIVLDIAFDAGTAYDFTDIEIRLVAPAKLVAQPTLIEPLYDPKTLTHSPGYLGFIIDVANWFVWWSVVSVLGLLIWYFPLWFMGISGYEALIFWLLLPAFVGAIGPLRRLLARYPQIALLLQAVGGVGAYWVKAPTSRVWWACVGGGIGTVALASSVTQSTRQGARQGQPLAESAAFLLGLGLHSVAKIWGRTNNPIWPVMNDKTGGYNGWGLALALGAAVLTVTHNTTGASTSAFDMPVSKPKECWIKAGLGLGILLYMLMKYVNDTSLLSLWVWEGFPVRGPQPVPHGILVLVAVLGGLWLGLTRRSLVLSSKAYVVSSVGIASLCLLKHWPGFTGGLTVAVYLGAVTPAFLEAAGRHSMMRTFGLASFIFCAFALAETWTVAYAFVPGGSVTRERTWALMVLEQILLGLGVWNARNVPAWKLASVRKVLRATALGIITVLALGSLAMFHRTQSPTPQPLHPEARALTAGIWTVHFGFDNDMWASEHRMADLIRDAEIDVVGLLETDTQKFIGAYRDMSQGIAEELGMYADYGPGPNKHTWGAALLSRFPIVNSTHHLTPSPVGELAPAIHATLDVYGELVDVIVFHSGQEEDEEDRRLQTAYVSEILASTPRPAILLSYLVTKPLEGNYNTWVSEYTGMHDIDPSDWDRWCEYILYKGLKRTGYARISRSTITDTELQIGRFVVGEPPNYSNERLNEQDVDPSLRLPSTFLGEGVRGHFYHVFNEPRYFA